MGPGVSCGRVVGRGRAARPAWSKITLQQSGRRNGQRVDGRRTAPRRAVRPRRGGAAAAPRRARVRPPAGARGRRADARRRSRAWSAPCGTASTGAGLRMGSYLHLAKLLVRNALLVVAVGQPRAAPPRLRQRNATHGRAPHRSSPTCCTLCCCCCCFDMAWRSACMSSCSTVGIWVEALDACLARRPLFACVDFLLTTKVRAPPRTQPLTAHAHVLTVCCACVLKQERGHRSCGKLGHAAAFRPKLSQTPPRTPVLGTSCPQKCILVSEVLAF